MLVVLDELSTAVLLCVLVETVLDDTGSLELLELLSTLDTIEEEVLVVVLVVVEVDDTTSVLSLETPVSLDLHPESKIAENKKIVKIRAFFIIFCPFQ